MNFCSRDEKSGIEGRKEEEKEEGKRGAREGNCYHRVREGGVPLLVTEKFIFHRERVKVREWEDGGLLIRPLPLTSSHMHWRAREQGEREKRFFLMHVRGRK